MEFFHGKQWGAMNTLSRENPQSALEIFLDKKNQSFPVVAYETRGRV